MKYVFFIDLRHLPYQTFINTLFYLMFYDNLVFKGYNVLRTKLRYFTPN